MTKKICISGYYGFNNFGDEIILKILVENLKKFDFKTDITVFSSNPVETSSLYDVKSVKSFNFLSVFFSLLFCNCLISGGGSLLQDVTSKKSLVYYLIVLLLAIIFGKKVIIFAQGIGPVNNKFLLKITKFVLKHANYITVRDIRSYNLLKQWNIESHLCHDPAWNINVKQTEKTNKLGIQLRSWNYDNFDFIKKLAYCIEKYYNDKEINILSLQNKADIEVCTKLKDEILKLNKNIEVYVIENTSNDKVIEDISLFDEMIAMRYHACVMAIKSMKKVLPVNYDIKIEELAKEFNINYLNLDETDDMESKIEKFKFKEADYNEEKLKKLKFDFKLLEKFI